MPLHRITVLTLLSALPSCSMESLHGKVGEKEVPRFASIEQLAQAYLSAERSGDEGALANLVHTKCSAQHNGGEVNARTSFMLRPEHRRLGELTRMEVREIQPTAPLVCESFADYPIRPTHAVQLDFDEDSGHSISIPLEVTHEKGYWWIVVPKPRVDGRLTAEAMHTEREQQEASIAMLVDGMASDLRAEVMNLVADGRKIDAIICVREATGVGLYEAKRAVEQLSTPFPDR